MRNVNVTMSRHNNSWTQYQPSTSTAEIKSGLLKGLPILLGYFPIGFAFGILAAGAGLNTAEAVMMSLLVFAGSAQLIAVGLIEASAGLAALAATTFLVNLRHLLMSAAVAPHLGHLSRLQQALFSYQLTDETFAVHVVDFKKERGAPRARLFATNTLAHLAWIGSTFLGAWTGALLGNLEQWGLDYALPAMFMALLVMQIDSKNRAVIALLSVTLSLFLFSAVEGHFYIIFTTLIAATAGLMLERRRPKHAR